ncbi:helix-turn-helix transcriptional regulator [Litoreibacter roseus]|nr:response regulator transcription factor [Litoreibacter roseus]
MFDTITAAGGASQPREAEDPVSSPGKIVLVSDRNPILSDGVAKLLSKDNDVKCEKAMLSAGPLGNFVAKHRPDAVIFDPSQDGAMPASAANTAAGIRYIAYVENASEEVLHECLSAEFSAVVAKTCSMSDLESALCAAFTGGVFLDDVFRSMLISRGTATSTPPIPDGLQDLSERETTVLLSIAQGLSLKQIAFDMGLSVKTVDTYKARAMKKLELSDRAAIFSYVQQHNLLT